MDIIDTNAKTRLNEALLTLIMDLAALLSADWSTFQAQETVKRRISEAIRRALDIAI